MARLGHARFEERVSSRFEPWPGGEPIEAEIGMPLRFQRRIKISPGISLNLNKKSVSASFGRRGAHLTAGPKGRRTTVGLPGTGVYYTIYRKGKPGLFLILIVVGIILLVILLRH
jgi:Protein of unknown function (DUF4236)